MRVLIVDDDQFTRRLIRSALADVSDVVVVEADSVSSAVAELDPPPDVVLLDIKIVGGSGWTVLAALRSRRWIHAKVAAITGQDSDRRLMRTLGFDEFFQKPFSIKELIDWVVAQRPVGGG